MSARTARGNRLGLALVGAALLLAGAAALARGLGWWPEVLGSSDAAVTGQSGRFAAEQGWFWPVLAAVLIVIGLLALRWLVVQARSGALRTLRLEPDSRSGTTTVPTRVVTGALTADLSSNGGPLKRVNAELWGSPSRPRLRLRAALPASVEPVHTHRELGRALWHQRQALELEQLPTVVLLRGS